MIINAKDNDFNNQIQGDELVLVDFWASWCGPCKMLGPVFEEISNEVSGVKFVKVNVDENPATARAYQVASIPTIIALKNGKIVDTSIGFRPKEDLLAFINKNK